MNYVGQGAQGPQLGGGGYAGGINADTAGPVAVTGFGAPANAVPPLMPDGLRTPSWLGGNSSPIGFGSGSAADGSQGGFLGVINGLINQIGTMLGGFANETNAEGVGSQSVSDGTFASTGDPHLSETGSVLDASGNASSVNRHFDSMTSHDNLLSSQDFDGGYRLSTTVTAPNAKGVTMNASATVHANSGQDTITMQNDGSVSMTSDGNAVSIAAGQSVVLGGGEQVTRNTDGSLTVNATNLYGGAISTTLAAKAGGVDVTAQVHNATVGGDIASGTANAPNPAPATGLGDPQLRYLQMTENASVSV